MKKIKVFKCDYIHDGVIYHANDTVDAICEDWLTDNGNLIEIVLINEIYISNIYFYTEQEVRKIKLDKLNTKD